MELGAPINLLRKFFENGDERWAVIGGIALLAHGIERATFDLDIVVTSETQPKLIEFLEERGYETLYRSTGYSNHHHHEVALGRLDVMYVEPATAEQIFLGCQPRSIGDGCTLDVPKPEHLAAMKVRAIKNDPSRKLQDLADIRQLANLPEADRGKIRGYFEELGLDSLLQEIDQ